MVRPSQYPSFKYCTHIEVSAANVKKKKKYPPAAAEVAAASAGESRAAAWALARQARRWSQV